MLGLVLFCVFYVITKFVSVPLCLFQNVFGIPCLGCGLTRGFIAVFRLDFALATQYHVLSIPLFIGISVYSVLSVTDILLNRNDLERIGRWGWNRYMVALLILLFIFYITFR